MQGSYEFALLDPRRGPQAQVTNDRVFAADVVYGVEATVPALAERCIEDIDPQHTGADVSTAAIEVALTCELPPAGATLATVRPDLDAFGTMAFKLLVTIVRADTEHTEAELGRLLLTDGFPDIYWAIARLVCFDNVQAFVDAIKVGSPGPSVAQLFMGEPATVSRTPPDFGRHPAFGQRYGRHQLTVDWRGMYIGIGFARFVHELSHIVEPRWWETFLRLTAAQGVIHSHPGEGGICNACIAADPDWYTNGFPYQLGHRES